MTDDEERRARRSEALAAARGVGRDDEERETDSPERRETRRRPEGESDRRREDQERRPGESRRRDDRERRDDRHHSGGEPVAERVSAVDHDAALVTAFEHDGYDCELGRAGDDLFGFVRVPADHDRLHLMWELDVPGEFGYGPDADGWVGFDTGPVDRELSPREAAMALAGLAAQVAERSRSVPR